MKWFKHDSDANMDAKLQEVLLDYGLEGYGLYWYCLEMIVNKIDVDNLTFELEHDCRIIARNTGATVQKVTEMMRRFVDLGLFQDSSGVITCLKLAQRLDKSMTSNAKMREMIERAKGGHDSIMMNHDGVMQDKKRIDKNRKEKKQVTTAAPKFDEWDMQFAEWALSTITDDNQNFKKPNLEQWAKESRLMRERDNRDVNQMGQVWQWARNDSFWCSNILSLKKFREKFDQLHAASQRPANSGYQTANEKAAARAAQTRKLDSAEDLEF